MSHLPHKQDKSGSSPLAATMKKSFYTKKIKVNKEGNYVIAHLFKDIKAMRAKYKELAPEEQDHNKIGGVCINREYYKAVSTNYDDITLEHKQKQTGFVLTCLDYANAGVVAHELMHAVLFAHGISKVLCKEQHPIIIKDMAEEEVILYAFTEAVNSYYRWYWSLKDRKLIK